MKKLLCVLTVLLFAGVSFAQSSTATVTQYGTNIAEITQTGTYDNAVITEGSISNPVNNSYRPAYVGDWIEGAFISQTGGNHNDASITITQSGDGAAIDQVGGHNEAYMNINTYYTLTTNPNRMGADIDQNGDKNYAAQTTEAHFGNFGIQGIFIDQDGSNNRATQYSIGGMNATMEIFQNGDKNGEAPDVSATTLSNPLNLPFVLKPAGKFTQYQAGEFSSSVAHISVTGNENKTAQYQEYTDFYEGGQNTATIDLTGSFNQIAQGQLGELNVSDVDITGDSNTVGSKQKGDHNTVDLTVGGNSNIAGFEQFGDYKTSTVTQSGNGNFSQVVQH